MRHFHASQRTRKKNTHVRRKKKIAAGLLACLLSGVFFSQNALARHNEAAPAPAEMQQAVKALEAGAFALVVGGAITRPAEITARFTGAINAAKK